MGSLENSGEKRLKKYHGFTLIEVVIVITIVGILAKVASSLFFSIATYNKQFYQDEIKNTMRYARKLAIASGRYIYVSVTSSSITLQFMTPGGSCGVGTTFSNIMDPISNTSGYTRTAPGTTTLTYSSDFPIYFNNMGQALGANNCAISSGVVTIGVTGLSAMTLYPQTGFIQ